MKVALVLWAVVAFFLIATAILAQRRVVLIKWWALPVLGLGLVMTFVVPAVVYPLIPWLDPALWIVAGSQEWGMVLWLSWIVAFIVIAVFRGITFVRSSWCVASILIFLLLMLPSSFMGCVASHMQPDNLFFWGAERSAVSPDGQGRAYVYSYFWRDIEYSLWYERNTWFHAEGRKASVGVDMGHIVPHLDEHVPPRVVWSRDAAVVTLWSAKTALLAWDVGKDTTMDLRFGHGELERLKPGEFRAKTVAFTESVQTLLDAHGGPAP